MRRGVPSGQVPRRMFWLAHEEAEAARHGYVGCEHLLLALLGGSSGFAREVLHGCGLHLQSARWAVRHVVGAGHGDGPRWHPEDLLAMFGIDLAAVRREVRAEFGAHAIDDLYASAFGRRLSHGPLCGLAVSPLLKKTMAGAGGQNRRLRRCDVGGEHLLLAVLDVQSPGLVAVLDALGMTVPSIRSATLARMSAAC